MNRSDNIAQLSKALCRAQGQMSFARKDSDNAYFKSKYADLAAVVEAAKKPLSDNGLSYVQMPASDGNSVTVETLLMHESGEWISSELTMIPTKADPQGMGSCITYARRYSLQAMLGIPAEDDDGNAASGTAGNKVAQSKLNDLDQKVLDTFMENIQNDKTIDEVDKRFRALSTQVTREGRLALKERLREAAKQRAFEMDLMETTKPSQENLPA